MDLIKCSYDFCSCKCEDPKVKVNATSVVDDGKSVNKENVNSSNSTSSQGSGQSHSETGTSKTQSGTTSESIRPIESGPAPYQDIHREPYLLGEAAKSGLFNIWFKLFVITMSLEVK